MPLRPGPGGVRGGQGGLPLHLLQQVLQQPARQEVLQQEQGRHAQVGQPILLRLSRVPQLQQQSTRYCNMVPNKGVLTNVKNVIFFYGFPYCCQN